MTSVDSSRLPVLLRGGPEHRGHRRQTIDWFTRERVESAYRELIQRRAGEQCETLRRRGAADLSALSFRLAVAVAAEVVGLPGGHSDMARRLDRILRVPSRRPTRSVPAPSSAALSDSALPAPAPSSAAPSSPASSSPGLSSSASSGAASSGSAAFVRVPAAPGPAVSDSVTSGPASGARVPTPRGPFRNLPASAFFWLDVRPAIVARRRTRRDDLISHLLNEGCTDTEILDECVAFAADGMCTAREFTTLAAWHLLTDEPLRDRYTSGADADRAAVLHDILRREPVMADLLGWTTTDTHLGDGAHRCPGAYLAMRETDTLLSLLFAMPHLRLLQEPRVTSRPGAPARELTGMILAA